MASLRIWWDDMQKAAASTSGASRWLGLTMATVMFAVGAAALVIALLTVVWLLARLVGLI